jgi:hypothetical protein
MRLEGLRRIAKSFVSMVGVLTYIWTGNMSVYTATNIVVLCPFSQNKLLRHYDFLLYSDNIHLPRYVLHIPSASYLGITSDCFPQNSVLTHHAAVPSFGKDSFHHRSLALNAKKWIYILKNQYNTFQIFFIKTINLQILHKLPPLF